LILTPTINNINNNRQPQQTTVTEMSTTNEHNPTKDVGSTAPPKENDDEKEKTTTVTAHQQMNKKKTEQEEEPGQTSERAEAGEVLDTTAKTQATAVVVCSFCGLPETPTRNFDKLKCPCKSTRYCNTTCQRKHWLDHKKNCQHLIAERKRKKKLEKEQRDRGVNGTSAVGGFTSTTMLKEDAHDPLVKKEEVNSNDDEDRKEKSKVAEPKKEEQGDECCICLEELSTDAMKSVRWTCCGQVMHIHCAKDLISMKMAGSCPLCRASRPTSDEETVKQLHPWVKKKKAWAQSHLASKYENGKGVKQSYGMARTLFDLAAQQGYVSAMNSLGNMYSKGQGVEQSYERAVEYYEQAAQLGHVKAQYNLGIMYSNGNGVEQSYERAVEYYEQAAHLGLVNLGNMYRDGKGVEESYETAFEYYVQAADLGDADAQFNVGGMYYQGQGVEKDTSKGREWFTKAAVQGDKDAIDLLKQLDKIAKSKESTSAPTTFSDSNTIVCSNCETPQTSTHKLIRCPCHSVRYCNKECQKKHRKKHKKECRKLLAEKKLTKQAQDYNNEEVAITKQEKETEEQGERKEDETTKTTKVMEEEEGDECPICLEILPNDATKFTRFTCCGNGIHIHCFKDMESMKMAGTCPFCRASRPTSDEECVKYLCPWVKKKKAWALQLMGQKYKDGVGVKQSYEMSRRLFELAAQQGDTTAMAFLGDMYQHEEGVEQSYKKAFEYYEQAAQLGHALAQYNLGVMYYNGQSVERDLTNARELFASAAAQGNEAAINGLKALDKQEGRTTTKSEH
jgi:TPR repeat protein